MPRDKKSPRTGRRGGAMPLLYQKPQQPASTHSHPAGEPRLIRYCPYGSPNREQMQAVRTTGSELLDLDGRANLGELRLDLLGLFLVDAFLDRLGCTVHQVLRLLEA